MGRKKSREEKGSKSSETIKDKSEEEDNNNKTDKNMSGDKRGKKRYTDKDINKTEETKCTDTERVRPNIYWP